ncbi:MAG TPA: diguanylate cyclase [Stellaceae bacterium]|nr:diguanylate cyclase [Stellaceae bacterium]
MSTSLKVFRDAFDLAKEASLITDGSGKIVAANREVTRLTGHTPTALTGEMPAALVSDQHDAAFHKVLADRIRGGDWEGEVWCRHKTGPDFLAGVSVTQIRSEDDGAWHLWVVRKLADRGSDFDGNEYLASHDPVTRLPNRLLLVDRLQRVCTRCKRTGTHAALLLLELDGLREVGEKQGQAIVDALLARTAEHLKRILRESDTVARLDSEEFAVILNEIADAADAERVAKHMQQRLVPAYTLDGKSYDVTVSVGITVMPTDGTAWTRVIRNADIALAVAQHSGTSTIRFSNEAGGTSPT